MRILLIVALVALATPTAARAEEHVLAPKQENVNIHAYRGIAVFSIRDGSAYRLVASTAGGAPQRLNVATQSAPFDADIGRGANGKPTVVLRVCHGEGCGLSLLALDGSAPKRTGIKVPHTNVRPTLWDKTIVWYEHGVVRTKTRTLTSVAKGTGVLALDLYGDHLALNLNASNPDAGVCGTREIKLLKLGAKNPHLIGRQTCGLDGQTFNGPSFEAGWLYFARACNTSCGASRYGAYRYRNGHYEIAGDDHPVVDWAWGGNGSAYQVRSQDSVGCSDPDERCTVVWTDGLIFKPVGAPIHPKGGTLVPLRTGVEPWKPSPAPPRSTIRHRRP